MLAMKQSKATPSKTGCGCGTCARCSATARDRSDESRRSSTVRDQAAFSIGDHRASVSPFGYPAKPPGDPARPLASVTTGSDDSRSFQTTRAADVPSGAFATTKDAGSDGGKDGGTPSHSCVPSLLRSSLPTGHIPATASGGRFAAPFAMTADFQNPVPCNGICGEYRQFVSGFSQVNGTDIVHPLCSNNLSRTTEHEDCLTSGGRDLRYGYHSIAFPNSRFINPDQATGSSYRGADSPGFNLAGFSSGDVLNWQLNFRGEWVDACDSDHSIVPSTRWTAGGTYTVP
jgi:hypothetical protein